MKKFIIIIMLVLATFVSLSVNVSAIEVATEAELNNAIAGTDTNIVLGGDFEILTTIKTSKDITLDLNGYKLTGPDDGASNWYAFIIDGGTFILKDTSADKTGELYAKCFGIETKAGTFIMESGKITATKNGGIGCAVVNYGGRVEIKGGTLVGAISALNMQAYFSDATTVISGGTLEVANGGDAAVIVGGEYTVKNETMTITDGEFKGETALLVDSEPILDITGGTYSSDISEYVDSEYVYDEETGEVVCGHVNLEEHEEVSATVEKEGTKAYWECEKCSKCFEDKDAIKEITDKTSLIIPKLEEDKEEETPSGEGEKEEQPSGEGEKEEQPSGEGEKEEEPSGEGEKEEQPSREDEKEEESKEEKNDEVKEKDDTKKEEKDESPKTGAKSMVLFFIVLACLGLIISKKEKRM